MSTTRRSSVCCFAAVPLPDSNHSFLLTKPLFYLHKMFSIFYYSEICIRKLVRFKKKHSMVVEKMKRREGNRTCLLNYGKCFSTLLFSESKGNLQLHLFFDNKPLLLCFLVQISIFLFSILLFALEFKNFFICFLKIVYSIF